MQRNDDNQTFQKKEYMYYLDIIHAILFIITYLLGFAPHELF